MTNRIRTITSADFSLHRDLFTLFAYALALPRFLKGTHGLGRQVPLIQWSFLVGHSESSVLCGTAKQLAGALTTPYIKPGADRLSLGNRDCKGPDLMNLIRTGLLLAVLTALFVGVGGLIAGQTGMIIAFVAAFAMNMWAYWNSDKMVLRMHNAVEVDEQSAPELYSIVRQLAENADLPMPAVYVMRSDQPNAFATGRNPENAAVAASTGLLDRLSKEEVAGVMAHELAHIKNRDTLTMTMTATIAGAISLLANYGMMFGGSRSDGGRQNFIVVLLVAILAPFAAGLVQMAISRTREYEADKLGAWICQRPAWLASALEKIAIAAGRIRNPSAENNPASAHLFIINPLSGERMDSLFSTHPNTENRIQALAELQQEWIESGEIDIGPQPMLADAKGPWERAASDSGRSRRRGPWS